MNGMNGMNGTTERTFGITRFSYRRWRYTETSLRRSVVPLAGKGAA